jgi:hypothetical protein|tara:strand:- start:74 stop:997 length:924 start_codon:yes stop_codon:yes gene_type:complete
MFCRNEVYRDAGLADLDHMIDDLENLFRNAFSRYLERRRGARFQPSYAYLSYDFSAIGGVKWHMWGGAMVQDEVRELTNILNHWHEALHKWQAWNDVIEHYGESAKWELREEFLLALAHQCMLRPSSVRDTMGAVATNAMHQVRLASESGYKDYLEGEPKRFDKRVRYLSRHKKERRLEKLVSQWPEGEGFMTSLREIDSPEYRTNTSDYRNRNSHFIGPRLAIGVTHKVVRSVVQSTELVKQDGGTYISTPMPGEWTVAYGFGGTPALDMEEARIMNLQQYLNARSCYKKYWRLLEAGMASMACSE